MPDADYTNPTVEYGWQHCLTLPRVLTQDGTGRLLQAPAAELNALRGEARQPADGETVETDPCFDLTAAPAGDFVLTIVNGLTPPARCTLPMQRSPPGAPNARLYWMPPAAACVLWGMLPRWKYS